MSRTVQGPDNMENSVSILDPSMVGFVEGMSHVLMKITTCLQTTLDLEFEHNQRFVPAALIFNPLCSDVAIWQDSGKAYGKARTLDAIEALTEVADWLKDREFEELSKKEAEKVKTRLRDHSGPLYHFVSDSVLGNDRIAILDATELLIGHLSDCLEAERGRRGNYRAFRTAVALRAIFESYSEIPIKVGDNAKGDPSGKYCQCLERVFSIVSLEKGFRHYAEKAQGRSPDDPLLLSMKQELIDVPKRMQNPNY